MVRYIALVFIIMVSLSDAKLNTSKFLSKVKQSDSLVVGKTIKAIEKSEVTSISKNVKLRKLTPKEQLIDTAETISKHSPYADKMINETKEPLLVIQTYSRYGDDFFKVAEVMDVKVAGLKLYSSTKIRAKSTSEIYMNVLQKTGKKGFELSKRVAAYAKEYPKSIAAGAMFAWFIADPNGFEDALHTSGDNIAKFASIVVGETASVAIQVPLNIADAVGGSIVTSFKDHVTLNNLLFMFIALFGFLGWKFRRIIFTRIQQRLSEKKKSSTQAFQHDEDELL